MADSQYQLSGAAMNSVVLPQSGSTNEVVGLGGLKDHFTQLSLDLATASLDIRLLVAEQVKLRETLALLNTSQQSLLKASAPLPVSGGETKSALKAEIEQRSPPDDLKSAMALQTAMVDLNLKVKLDPDDLQALSVDNQKLASDKQIAPSGATPVQLAQAELAAVNAGLVKGVKPEDLKQTLADFARDSGVMASAYKIDIKEAGAIMTGWRTTLGLDREKSLDLGNAATRLGASINLNASATDIGSVVQRGGKEGFAAGMTPEQVAAIAAALLNASVGKDEAGASLKTLGTAFGKGSNATAEQRTAWAQLDIEPGALVSRMRTDASGAIKDVLAALKNKPAEQQTSLIKTLFEGDEGIRKLVMAPQDLNTAFKVASGEGSMAQTAEVRGNTSQARWNALDASLTRLDTAIANAVSPFTDLAMLSAGKVISGFGAVVETLPKVAAALTLLGAALTTPLRGAILSKLVSVASSTATELLKPDAAIQPQLGSDNARTSRPTMRNRLVTSAARAKSFTGRLGVPLAIATVAYDGIKALMAGDYKAAAGAAGSGAGALAGGYAGAATGAMIGSFIPVPVLGTAVGGLIGGLVGSYFGSSLGEEAGETLYTAADRLQSPDQVSKDLTSATADNRQVNYSPLIQISGADPTDTERLIEKIMANLRLHFNGEFMPLMMTNPLAVRSDAALTDGGT